jgi:MarR family 2-MHQ and catechol resistance regulon transcriptional repressor
MSPRAKSKPDPYLRTVRLLVEAYFAFVERDAVVIRRHGLTPSQFDVVATLGNTDGMSCGELSERTLVTKGTLTGIVDRLAARGVVERSSAPHDRRSIVVRLTAKGDRVFRTVFPVVVGEIRPYVERALNAADRERLCELLAKLRDGFRSSSENDSKGERT